MDFSSLTKNNRLRLQVNNFRFPPHNLIKYAFHLYHFSIVDGLNRLLNEVEMPRFESAYTLFFYNYQYPEIR